jgi:hypothetical protein
VCRVREAKRDGMKVVDVDGSYLHRKQALSNADDTPEVPTSIPLTGWVTIDNPASADVDKIPRVTPGNHYGPCMFVSFIELKPLQDFCIVIWQIVLGKVEEGKHFELSREDLLTGPQAAYQKLKLIFLILFFAM